VREEVERIVFRARRVLVGIERTLLRPNFLPLRFDGLWIVFGQDYFPRALDFDFVRALTILFGRREDLRRAGCWRGLKPSRAPVAGTILPSSFQTEATLRRSSPGLSMGVSRMKARPASNG